jgi:hypothetical protein
MPEKRAGDAMALVPAAKKSRGEMVRAILFSLAIPNTKLVSPAVPVPEFTVAYQNAIP